jgi:hypothetical protein
MGRVGAAESWNRSTWGMQNVFDLSAGEEDLLRRVAAEQARLAQSRQGVMLNYWLTAEQALRVAACLQVSLLHPENNGASAEAARAFIASTRAWLLQRQCAAMVELLDFGRATMRQTDSRS